MAPSSKLSNKILQVVLARGRTYVKLVEVRSFGITMRRLVHEHCRDCRSSYGPSRKVIFSSHFVDLDCHHAGARGLVVEEIMA